MLSRFLNGLLLPVALFILWQLVLAETTRGTGSFAGMVLFFASLFVVPALLVLNLWVVLIRWRGHFAAFFAGLAIPAAAGALELVIMYGSKGQHRTLQHVIDSPLLPLAAIPFFLPLIATLVHRAVQSRKSA